MEWHPKTQEEACVCSPLKSGSIVELHYSRFLLLAGSLDSRIGWGRDVQVKDTIICV